MKSIRKILLTSVICIALGYTGGYYYATTKHHQALSTCEQAVQKSQGQVEKFCQGHQLGESNLGAVRVSEVVCNGKKELCFCGVPDIFRP
jgi:hypothetical protein